MRIVNIDNIEAIKLDAASHRPKSVVSLTLSNAGVFKSLAILIEIINVQTCLNLDLTFRDSYLFRETERGISHAYKMKRSGSRQLWATEASRSTYLIVLLDTRSHHGF